MTTVIFFPMMGMHPKCSTHSGDDMVTKMLVAAAIGASLFADRANAIDQLDDLQDVCNFSASPQEARLVNATALLVPTGLIHLDPGGATYHIDASAFLDDGGAPICSDSRFYGELSAQAGRTGVLIGPNLILTAAHTAPLDPSQWLVVFRDSLATAGGSGCSNFKWTNIPATDVYQPASSSTVVNLFGSSGGKYDYAAFQLSTPVTGRDPVKIRRSGSPRFGNATISVGYPLRTAEKVSTAAIFAGVNDATTGFGVGSYLYANHLNGFDGSSGSPDYDIDDETINDVVAGSNNARFETAPGLSCLIAVDENLVTPVNGPLVDIATSIPRYDILVSPLTHIVHKSDLGAVTPQPITTYSVLPAPSGGNLILLNSISGPTGPATTTPVVSLSPSSGIYTVPAGGMTFNFNASTTAITQCGTWDFEVNVLDVSRNENNYARHRFEVGLVEISAEPEDDWIVEDMGPTYSQTRTYTVKNVRPTATTIEVYAGGDLPSSVLTINGGGMQTATLGPAGSPTDTATFVIGISSSINAASAPNTDYNLFVDFANTNFQCAAQDVQQRNIKFRRNEKKVISAQGSTLLANPASGQSLGVASRFDFDLTGLANYCVTDINLDVGMPSPGGGLAGVPQDVRITLTSPSGQSGIIWDRNISPGGSYSITDTFDSVMMGMLHLDDQVSPPLGPKHLSYFNGLSLPGHWYVDVQSAGGAIDVIGPDRIDISANTCTSK